MVSVGTRDVEQARRLERGLVRVRWFAVALGLYLVSQTNAGQPPRASTAILIFAYSIIAGLTVGNLVIWRLTEKSRTLSELNRVGLSAFMLDIAAVLALAWAYSYDPRGSSWVVMYILPLEGAIRYRLEGAMVTIGITLVNEVAREAYLAARFAHPLVVSGAHIDRYPFLISNVAFRVGIDSIIALVAGFMARSLAREAEKSAQQALRFQELARRETAARSELSAFNTAVLTGVAAEDLDMSLRLMAEAIGRDLGFETFSILLRDGDELVVKAMHGMPFYEERVPIGRGVTGTVAATGNPLRVPDVTAFPGYIMVDPEMRSEMATPLRIGEELIGVLDVESREIDAFSEASLTSLARLADQIALVAHSNRLLSHQRETMMRLQELDQMKSDFVAITSHELRTPITAIRGFVKTLLRNRERLSEEQLTNFMVIIDRQSGRLARLVEDLLFVSRIEAGTIRLQMEEVDMAALLRESVESLGPEGRSRVKVQVEPDRASVVIDPQRVDQIVRNLVENALKFSSPESTVDVDAALRDGAIELGVTDRGVGIREEDLPRIFDRFHQSGKVLTREAEGAGLGLYITKRLAEAMGGAVSVRSRRGEGSTFTVTIPNRPASMIHSADGERDADQGDQVADAASRSAPNASAKSANR